MNNDLFQSSFRDPAGHVFRRGNTILRKITAFGKDNYSALVHSGLYESLILDRQLIAHEELNDDPIAANHELILLPEQLEFVTYPYEWCFSQLRDAALLLLDIQEKALGHGLTLRDATPFNVQFQAGRAVMIDISSLGVNPTSSPWHAYRQFCEMFLAPLALMSYVDPGLVRTLRVYLDGIPLDLAGRLLPMRAMTSLHRLIHLYVHGRISHYAGTPTERHVTNNSQLGLIESLRRAVTSLPSPHERSQWSGYYQNCPSYSAEVLAMKRGYVNKIIEAVNPGTIWDLGCSGGMFSLDAADRVGFVLALDADHSCVESLYKEVKNQSRANLLPILMDISNPSTSLGWAGLERMSLADRGPADMVLVLALIHHLVVKHQVPFAQLARYLHVVARHVLVEFVPADDMMVQIMLRGRSDCTEPQYDLAGFEAAFAPLFELRGKSVLSGSGRHLYHFERRG